MSLTTLLLFAAACSSGGSSGNSSSGSVSEALDPKTEPIAITTTVDEGAAASARIGPDGGRLAATGADGSQYSLDIPAGALVEEVEVRMIPIASMEGLPLAEGLAAGVRLEPEGMSFYDFVTLTIDPAEAIAADQLLPVGSAGETGALYMPLIDLDPDTIRLRLLHFSSAGVSKGLLADIEPVRQRLGGDAETRILSLASAEMARARQAGESGPDMETLENLFQLYREQVLKPRLAAAGESCAAGRLAIETVLSYGRQRQLLGLPDDSMTEAVDLMPTMARVCLQEEYELCRDEHIVHRMIPSILSIERQRQLLGITSPEMNQVMDEAENLAVKCLRFELEFDSSADVPTPDGGGVTSVVESNVTLPYEAGSLAPPSGSSALENTSYKVVIPPGGCTATGVTGGGTFSVISLNWLVTSTGLADEVGQVEDILLRYDPGQTTEIADITCPQATMMGQGLVMGQWHTFFLGTHIEEIYMAESGAESGLHMANPVSMLGFSFLATGWDVSGGELFAELEWDKSVGGINEEGSFKLYHRPQ
ncbi:MAG TPA: hypothetical protein VFI11_15400 [Anaerolineales bacterium]|nr:hypothetical protein [Anaerolineales bacterium]